jgi:hypothetical protein
MEKHLHIICLTIPYPVDYGGVIDLFYKLSALKKQGVKIHLHCYKYQRNEQPLLKEFCETVSYYPRQTGLAGVSLTYPYIVKSRCHEKLVNLLAKDDYPILAEGVHCTCLLNDRRIDNRRFFVRLHNVEYRYYRNLSCYETFLPRKLYYLWESFLLRRYELRLAKRATILAVTEKDAFIYRTFGCKNAFFLPVFLPPWVVNTTEGKGSFCLYHGDLTVAENEKAVKWLLTQVFDDLAIPFVIAGKNPSQGLTRLVHKNPSTCLIANPGHEEMQDLISKAHINVLPSYTNTGIKLKLLNAVFNGKHCIVNSTTAEGSGLEEACIIVENASGFKDAIRDTYSRSFTSPEIELRRQLIQRLFDNEKTAIDLIKFVWPG